MQKQHSQSISECDLVIVGAGVIGLAIAYSLADGEKSILVIDRHIAGQEASAASGGMIRPITEFSGNTAFLEMCLESARMYPSFIKQLEIDAGINIEYSDVGGILLAKTEEEMKELSTKGKISRKHGVQALLLSKAQVLAREPLLTGEYVGGLFMPSDHQLNNRRLVEALCVASKKKGVTMLEHANVLELLEENRKVRGIKTADKTIRAKEVICCTGAWTCELLPEIKMTPVKGQMLRYDTQNIAPQRHVISCHPLYLIPRQDKTLVVGSTMEEVGFNKETTFDAINHLKKSAQAIIPALTDCKIVETWAGLRPKSKDSLPVIGKIKDGLYVASGHFRNGILLAPLTTKIMKDALKGNVHPLVNPGRFL